MSHDSTHPAQRFESDVRAIQRRATLASIALVCSVGIRVFNLVVHLWQNSLIRSTLADQTEGRVSDMEALQLSDRLTSLGAIGLIVFLLITATLFLRWLHGVVRLTRALGGDTMRWSPSDAVWGFIIPFVSFKRPYEVLRDVYAQLLPETVPEPQAQAVVDEMTGYREVHVQAPPPPMALPDASIGAWWTAFWIGNLVANFAGRMQGTGLEAISDRNLANATADCIEMFSATLAILVVRGVTARLVERYRRVRHNPTEVLKNAGILLDAA